MAEVTFTLVVTGNGDTIEKALYDAMKPRNEGEWSTFVEGKPLITCGDCGTVVESIDDLVNNEICETCAATQ